MQAPYLLVSEADWCGSSFELYTQQPRAEMYRHPCPECKRTHSFTVLKRTNLPE